MVLNVHRTIRLIRDGETGGRGYGGEERGRLYTYRYTVTTRTTALRWPATNESHFNVSLIVRDKVTRVSTNYNFLREGRTETVSNRGSSAYVG